MQEKLRAGTGTGMGDAQEWERHIVGWDGER
jgi:hypothetical protein